MGDGEVRQVVTAAEAPPIMTRRDFVWIVFLAVAVVSAANVVGWLVLSFYNPVPDIFPQEFVTEQFGIWLLVFLALMVIGFLYDAKRRWLA
jgi:hypothetical protein